MGRMNPKMGWKEILNEDESRMSKGVTSFVKYDHEARCGKGMAHCFVNATPRQICGWYAHDLTKAYDGFERVDATYTTSLNVTQIPIPLPTISPREALTRSAWFRNEAAPKSIHPDREWAGEPGRSFTIVSYSVEDERRPAEAGKVRQHGRMRQHHSTLTS
jgi:hypothetical protein